MNNIMVKIASSDGFLRIRTYSRQDGRNGSFLMSVKAVSEWLRCDGPVMTDMDIENYMSLVKYHGSKTVFFVAMWLCSDCGNKLTGLRQQFGMPISLLKDALNGEDVKYLYKEPVHAPYIDMANAQNSIRKALETKAGRHALRKAMRDNFQWNDEVITFYDDGQDFFFEAGGGLVGGLCRSDFQRMIHGKLRDVVHYGVHT